MKKKEKTKKEALKEISDAFISRKDTPEILLYRGSQLFKCASLIQYSGSFEDALDVVTMFEVWSLGVKVLFGENFFTRYGLPEQLHITPSRLTILNYTEVLSDIKDNIRDTRHSLLEFKSQLSTNRSDLQKHPLINLPSGSTWESLTLQLLNNWDVEIYISGKFWGLLSCEKLGFLDKRKKQPNQQWRLLQNFSLSKSNEIYWPTYPEKKKGELAKRKQLLSRKLQLIFNTLKGKPIQTITGSRTYRTSFKINPEAAFEQYTQDEFILRS